MMKCVLKLLASSESDSKNLISPSHANELLVSPGCTLAQIIIKSFFGLLCSGSSEWGRGFVIERILTGLSISVLAKTLTCRRRGKFN